MRENKTTKLIEHLIIHGDDWVSSKQLSIVLGVSTRQVRKYISSINNTCEDFVLIYSGKQGYRLDPTQYEYYRKRVEVQKDYTPQQRYDYIIQKLIVSPKGYDIFNLSDELYVSMPTIERDLKHIREFVKEYQLTINRDRNSLILNGKESDKRSIMGSLLSSKEYNSFVLSDKVQLLSFHYHLWEFRTNIYRILSENKVFCNDYTLNDIALHLIIMIDRIRNSCMLTSTVDITPFQSSDNYHATQEIVNYIENEYEIKINNAEFYQLLLIITNNSITVDAGKLTPDNLDQFIDKRYIEMTETILSNIEQTYYLEYFDPTFKVKMALHLWALFRRVKNNTFAKNPLTNEVKSTYPLIYDIAVFFAQQIKEKYNLFVNEDEIAYLAFHIGSYFENTARNQKRLNCMFVYVEYHNTQQITMERIQQIFEDKIDIKHVVPISMYQPDTIEVDLVISTVDLEFPYASVIVSPFITEKELSKLRIAIDKELQKKRKQALISYLQTFVDERLFYVNAGFKNQSESITTMGNDAIRYGYVNEGFVEDVFDRQLKTMKQKIDMLQEVIKIIESIQPLFETHELYKINQEDLYQRIQGLFQRIQEKDFDFLKIEEDK